MASPFRQFTVIQEHEACTVGIFQDEESAGIYLTSDYLHRLGDVLAATKIRLSKMGDPALPDAMRNLIGIIDRLLETHRRVNDRESEHNPAEYERATKELAEAIEALKAPNGGDDGPKRA